MMKKLNELTFSSCLGWLNRHPFLSLCLVVFTMVAVSSFKPDSPQLNTRIGIVDLDAVVAKSNEGKKLEARLRTFQQQVEAEVNSMRDDGNRIRQSIEDGRQSLSAEKLEELRMEFENKVAEIRRYTDEKTREGEKIKNEGLKQMEREFEPVVKALSEEEGLDLLLNQTPGITIWASESINLTQKLIDKLNN